MHGRIMGIDYGKKRVGVAATDPLQIIVSPVDTVETDSFEDYLAAYIQAEPVVKIVFGFPYRSGNVVSENGKAIEKVTAHLRKRYPNIPIELVDESYTSRDAMQVLIQSGVKQKKRRDKKLLDKMSAVLILQKFLGHI